jgi:hypothetical protein
MEVWNFLEKHPISSFVGEVFFKIQRMDRLWKDFLVASKFQDCRLQNFSDTSPIFLPAKNE